MIPELAEEFVKRYKLKATSIPVVHKHIEQTIAEFHASNQEIRPQTPPAEEDESTEELETVNPKASGGMEEPADIPPSPQLRNTSVNQERSVDRLRAYSPESAGKESLDVASPSFSDASVSPVVRAIHSSPFFSGSCSKSRSKPSFCFQAKEKSITNYGFQRADVQPPEAS